MFQSLIGTLKTSSMNCGICPTSLVSIPNRDAKNPITQEDDYGNVKGFQSLIGTLKTLGLSEREREGAEFQSLIGTLKTYHLRWYSIPSQGVSIPNRDAKNPLWPLPSRAERCVSIPNRDAKNTVSRSKQQTQKWFQSLIGTLKTPCRAGVQTAGTHVSIPNRDAKNFTAVGSSVAGLPGFNP